MTRALVLNTLLLAGMLSVGLLAHVGRAMDATALVGGVVGLSLGLVAGRWLWREPAA